MTLRASGLRFAGALGLVLVIGGCTYAAPTGEPTATPSASNSAWTPSPTPSPSFTAAPEPVDPTPLITVSGSVSDVDGNTLSVTLTSTSVRPPNDKDRADFAATRCANHKPSNPFGDTDTRVVTFAVDSVGSPGFAGWSKSRGIRVLGTLFSGTIWEPEAHGKGSTCYQDSVISRPGSGEVRSIVSSKQWKVESPVVGDSAVTLAMYGFESQVVDALGKPTGLSEATNCSITLAPEYFELASSVVPVAEPIVPGPDYQFCYFGTRSYSTGG